MNVDSEWRRVSGCATPEELRSEMRNLLAKLDHLSGLVSDLPAPLLVEPTKEALGRAFHGAIEAVFPITSWEDLSDGSRETFALYGEQFYRKILKHY